MADATPDTAPARASRKQREGTVVSSAMDKTAIVAVIDQVRHPRYAKTVQRTKRLYAHDETNDANIGDRVRVQETRPLGGGKRWRVVVHAGCDPLTGKRQQLSGSATTEREAVRLAPLPLRAADDARRRRNGVG